MFYAVWNGKEGNKIYDNWNDCQINVNKVSGVRFHKFKTQEECENFIRKCENDDNDKVAYDNKINYPCVFVDGSINPETGNPGWAYIFLRGENENPIENNGECNIFKSTRNVIGELTATLNALKLCYKLKLDEIYVYHDYNGIAEWAEGRWKAKEGTVGNWYIKELKPLLNNLKVHFVKVESHTGVEWNEKVDKLAKRGCGVN